MSIKPEFESNDRSVVNVLMCADENVLAGLHVAAFSLLAHLGDNYKLRLFVFTARGSRHKLEELETTLEETGKEFSLEIGELDDKNLQGLPKMRSSLAPYFRLLAIPELDVARVLYVDIDTLCLVDVGVLFERSLDGHEVAMLAEAEIATCADETVRRHPDVLNSDGPYFNSGVLLASVDQWKSEDTTSKCLKFLAENSPQYWDQSALNVVLQGRITRLEAKYNFITNKRENWPELKDDFGINDKLLHFTDFPKPWSPCADWVHPFFSTWFRTLKQIPGYARLYKRGGFWSTLRSGRYASYKKLLKDRLLMNAWRSGITSRVKGVPECAPGDTQ